MKQVASKDEAIEKAYYMGMIAQFGSLKIEGIGTRKTNWGISTTFLCKGIPIFLAQEALSWIIDIEKTFRNKKDLSVPLTTIEETTEFSHKLGVFHILDTVMELVKEHDENQDMKDKWKQGGGRINDDSPVMFYCPLKEYETDIAISIIEELEHWASYDVIAKAFNEGKHGLTLGENELKKIAA